MEIKLRTIYELLFYPTYEKFYYTTYEEALFQAQNQVNHNGITSYAIFRFIEDGENPKEN